MYLISIICLLCVFNPTVLFERNSGGSANREFRFKNISSPVADDAGASAKLTLIGGEIDAGSAELQALIDGRLPANEDEPAANVFFNAGSSGGRFRMDLGKRSTSRR